MKPEKLDILVADDEQSMREFLEIVLSNEGYQVLCVCSGEKAMEVLRDRGARIFIQDLRMGGLDGMQLLETAREAAPEMPILVMTAFSTSDVAMEAMRRGGFDFLRKPFQNDDVRGAVRRALESTTEDGDSRPRNVTRRLIGNTAVMRELFEVVEQVAPTESTILVTGESGCGKELIARAIHDGSPRNQGRFVAVNCSAFTEGLLESELFGHVKGAFTGAVADRKGVFLSADGGTLFLDEVADMSLSTQVRILRSLEDRKVIPVGGDQQISTDVRIIAATNKDLAAQVKQGLFREDLFYRIHVIPLHLPPLRDRKDDLPLLAGHFLRRHSQKMGKAVDALSDGAWESLQSHHWPGNVRELENVIQRQVALARGRIIESIQLDLPSAAPENATVAADEAESAAPSASTLPAAGCQLEQHLERVERDLILQALERTGGNQTRAAELLGVSYRQIRYRAQKLGIRSRTVSEAP
jgi:two-component system response regulator PilR (NtrC family)